MRHPLAKLASFALVAPLAGSMLFATGPASAAPAVAAKTVTAEAPDPYSTFVTSVKAPKKVKAGGKITYKIAVKNLGPHQADRYWLGGKLPKGIVDKLYWDADEGTE